MNKDIKFRFVYSREVDSKICYQFYTLEEILDGKYSEYKILHDGFIHVRTDRFTGLTDKGGFNIYEGDTCKAPHDFGPGGWEERTFKVHWDNKLGYQWSYWDLSQIEILPETSIA